MKKLFLEMLKSENTINFIIVDQDVKNTNPNLLLLEEYIPDLDTSISVASTYAKYYSVFYPEMIKNIKH